MICPLKKAKLIEQSKRDVNYSYKNRNCFFFNFSLHDSITCINLREGLMAKIQEGGRHGKNSNDFK